MTHTETTAQDMPERIYAWKAYGENHWDSDNPEFRKTVPVEYIRADLTTPPISREDAKAALDDIDEDLDSGNYCGQLFLSRKSYDYNYNPASPCSRRDDMMDDFPDWPHNINKPKLPDGYEWVCLRQAWGIVMHGKNPWYVRVRETKPRGRFVKMGKEYFYYPENAIAYAVERVKEHKKARVK